MDKEFFKKIVHIFLDNYYLYVKIKRKMQGKIKHEAQLDLFKPLLINIISPKRPLVSLTKMVEWEIIEKEFGRYYSTNGRPSVPTRTMVGLLLLKCMFSVSDEDLIPAWIENPYWQYFCGEQYFTDVAPCDPSDLVHFRKRIDKEGMEFILKQSIKIHGSAALEESVVIDTTVQEKDTTYPVDVKLYHTIIKNCWSIGADNGIKFHQSFRFLLKQARKITRFVNQPKNRKSAYQAIRKIKGYAGKLLRELERKLSADVLSAMEERFSLYHRVLKQKRTDKDKIYSLHEPHIYCMAKGKEHKKYEFGVKASIAVTKDSGIIVGSVTFEKNIYDAHTLEATLQQVKRNTNQSPKEAICDRGYKGVSELEGTKILIPKPLPSNAKKKEIEETKKKFRRRSAIEPIISHLKYDHRMIRNHLKGIQGDFINCVLASAGFNFMKMLRKIASSLALWLDLLVRLFLGSPKKLAF